MNEQHALVVDDSKVGRLTMMKKLEAMGLKVDLVESGRQALDYLAHHKPHVIFMDHMMPDMDGFETTRRIKADPASRDIPVIIISGNDDEDFVREARASGALNAISKPPGDGVLEALLHDLPTAAASAAQSRAAGPGFLREAEEKPKTPALDQAAVHALVERMLGEALEHLHAELQADVGRRLDQARADLEERLARLEAEAGRPPPDVDALGTALQQRFTGQLDELRHAAERQGPALESLRGELSARLDEGLAMAGQGVSDLAERLDGLSVRLGQLVDDSQRAREGMELRLVDLDMRQAALEGAQTAPDAETILAAAEERFGSRMDAMRSSLQATPGDETLCEGAVAPLRTQYEALRTEFDGQHGRLEAMEQNLSTLEAELVAQGEALRASSPEADGRLQALDASEAGSASTQPLAQEEAQLPADAWQVGMQAEVGRLKARVKTLTLLLAGGGVVLLLVLAGVLLGG